LLVLTVTQKIFGSPFMYKFKDARLTSMGNYEFLFIQKLYINHENILSFLAMLCTKIIKL